MLRRREQSFAHGGVSILRLWPLVIGGLLAGCSMPGPTMGSYDLPAPPAPSQYQYDPAPAVADAAPAAPSTVPPLAPQGPSWGTAAAMTEAGVVGGHLANKALSSARPTIGTAEGSAALDTELGEGAAAAVGGAEGDAVAEGGLALFLEDAGLLLLLE